MSYMTQLEIHAREAVAMSLLNGLRHATRNRELSWDQAEKNIFLEALDFSGVEKNTEKMFFYSFRGMGENNEAAALQLSEALMAALQRISAQGIAPDVYITAMRKVIDNPESASFDETKLVDKITSCAMDIISATDLAAVRGKMKYGTGL